MRRTPTLIVGGGPAGAAAAITLARAGQPALLIERDHETKDALCGGFLSWATLARLSGLGVDALALGAHRVDRVALFAGTRSAEARLPATAAGLSRRALDIALLSRAEWEGTRIERGLGARAFEEGVIRLDDGAEIEPDHLILATGKHELRGLARQRDGIEGAVGLRWRLGASPALRRLIGDGIELHLFRDGYAGLMMQEEGANLCLAVRQRRLADTGGKPDRLLAELAAECPALARRLDATAAIGPVQAIANVPYGWRQTEAVPGLSRIGDQAGVIPSLAGEGIDIALATGIAAARAIGSGAFQPAMAARLRRPIGLATALWRLAEHPAGARAMIVAIRMAPPLAGLAARLTRVD